jgi:hypothetical protein
LPPRATDRKTRDAGVGGEAGESEEMEEDARESDCKPPTVHIHHILMCPLPKSALMIPNVIDPIKIKMINAGMVATAHLTIRTTIDLKGILMSVTMTLP